MERTGWVTGGSSGIGAAVVRRLVVAPGITDTPMMRGALGDSERLAEMATSSPLANPQRRVLEAGDVADAIVYLCSDGSGRITGQTLHVNGGSIMP